MTSLRVSPEGEYEPGFMYWYPPYGLFMYPTDFVLLGEVTHLEPPRDASDMFGGASWSGRLEIKRVVLCPQNLVEQAAQIRTLVCRGFDGLTLGDRVLVFLVAYEGDYAVPVRQGTNSTLGYKLERHPGSCFDPLRFVDLLSRGRAWNLRDLTADEMLLWKWVDPHGLENAVILETGWRLEPQLQRE